MTKSLPKYLSYAFLGLIAYLPFHGFISTWIISNNNNELRYKAWKEVLIVIMFLMTIILIVRKKGLFHKLINRRINQIIIAYGLLHLVLAMLTEQTTRALLHGLVINLRFLAIFVIAQVIAETYKSKTFKNLIVKALLIVSTIISVIVVIQLLLPREFLEWFGYSKETISPYFTIDRNLDFVRYASTTRGPNVLGAYLILPITIITASFFVKKNWRRVGQAVIMLVAMALTFSRSAWLGLLASVGAYKIYFAPEKVKTIVRRSLPILLIFIAVFVAVFATTDFIQNTVLHQDPGEGGLVDSTGEHISSVTEGLEDIRNNPFGSGPGTAGPASRSNDGKAKISENYFVQVGQEVGVIGLGLFVWINILLGKMLLDNKNKEIMKQVLFCTLIGLTIVSMLLHGWADEEVSLTFWGFAGLYLDT